MGASFKAVQLFGVLNVDNTSALVPPNPIRNIPAPMLVKALLTMIIRKQSENLERPLPIVEASALVPPNPIRPIVEAPHTSLWKISGPTSL